MFQRGRYTTNQIDMYGMSAFLFSELVIIGYPLVSLLKLCLNNLSHRYSNMAAENSPTLYIELHVITYNQHLYI